MSRIFGFLAKLTTVKILVEKRRENSNYFPEFLDPHFWWPDWLCVLGLVCQWGWSQFGQRLFSKLIYVDWHQSITGKWRRREREQENRKEEREYQGKSSPWKLERRRTCWDCKIDFLEIKVLLSSYTIKALRSDKLRRCRCALKAFKAFLRTLEINTNWDLKSHFSFNVMLATLANLCIFWYVAEWE